MPGVLAWIVAVECHTPPDGATHSRELDFRSPVSQRALDWAAWLRQQPDTRLLLNIAAKPGSAQAQQAQALQGVVLNPQQLHRADKAALRHAWRLVQQAPRDDILLLLWIGHGLLHGDERCLLVQDAVGTEDLQSWHLGALLRSLRSRRDTGPQLQIGVVDACADQPGLDPGMEKLPGAGKFARRQHFYFAATAGMQAALPEQGTTLASLALQQLQAQPWPPRIEDFDAGLRAAMKTLPSMPVAWEFTEGSGELWSRAAAGPGREHERWAQPLAALGLSAPQWMQVAAMVGQDDGRTAPRCSSVGELLDWVLALADPARARRALLALCLGALRMAEAPAGAPAAACQALRRQLQEDAALAPLLPAVEAALPALQEPLVLLVELDLPEAGDSPVLRRHWLLRHGRLEPGRRPDPPLQGPCGEQLAALMHQVRMEHAGALRLELLAPLPLLAGRPGWTSYRFDADDTEEQPLDTLVPICWRWRERMMGRDPRFQTPLWRDTARSARERVARRAQLHCQFDDEPAGYGVQTDVVALAWAPPGPGSAGAERMRFRTALLAGHPYMVWPGDAPADPALLKAQLRDWLAQQVLPTLPEGHRDARRQRLLPSVVLFLDEPERNPYDAAQPGFSTEPQP